MSSRIKTAIGPHRTCYPEAQPGLFPGGDLWRYAPARGMQGEPLCDLMMLLPAIKHERALRVLVQAQLQSVLEGFGDKVFFANLNIRLGILWVTVKSEPGLCGEVVDAIRSRIEGARTVCNYVQGPQKLRLTWREKVQRLLT